MKTRRWTLAALIAVLTMTTACSPWQTQKWMEWHDEDPAAAEEWANNECGELCTNDDNHDGIVDGQRRQHLEQAPAAATSGGSSASSGGRCVGYEGLLADYSPGWNVQQMSRIMMRESRCQPGAYNRSGATGLLQVLKSHCGWLAPRIGPCNLTNPSYNIRAAAELYRNGGSAHWAQTR